MAYLAYLVCLVLMLPAFGLTLFVSALLLFAAGPRDGWSVLIQVLAFFGAGIEDPLRYGWRILAFFAVLGFVLGAGAIAPLRIPAFYGLAVVGASCALFCLYAAAQQDRYNVINALIVLSPSFVGMAACLWCAAKFRV
ncbi:hypothetical protein [Bryobacter aggregatus]|uniref:hypothetical protein n=1 Tax=Bryobacter aggregatus TaxID=360054 RepID=UPI0012BB0B14|nr:hypothetical protein [Bryobacter aggregatus]